MNDSETCLFIHSKFLKASHMNAYISRLLLLTTIQLCYISHFYLAISQWVFWLFSNSKVLFISNTAKKSLHMSFCNTYFFLKYQVDARDHWLTPVTLATVEAEIRRTAVPVQSWLIVCKTPS
jgi:hypothetical protein